MNNIGTFYHDGKGVPRDLNTARQWYEKALAAGSHVAAENLQVLDRRSTAGRRQDRRHGGGGSYAPPAPRQGLSPRGRPCFLPSEQGIC